MSQELVQPVRLVIFGLFTFLAVKASRIRAHATTNDKDSSLLRIWLSFSFWALWTFSSIFMRCHYLILTILIFPPLLAVCVRIQSRIRRIAILVLAAIGFAGFSHPIPFFLMFGGITNYVAPDSFPLTWYNLIAGYPAALILAVAVWLAITGLKAPPNRTKSREDQTVLPITNGSKIEELPSLDKDCIHTTAAALANSIDAECQDRTVHDPGELGGERNRRYARSSAGVNLHPEAEHFHTARGNINIFQTFVFISVFLLSIF